MPLPLASLNVTVYAETKARLGFAAVLGNFFQKKVDTNGINQLCVCHCDPRNKKKKKKERKRNTRTPAFLNFKMIIIKMSKCENTHVKNTYSSKRHACRRMQIQVETNTIAPSHCHACRVNRLGRDQSRRAGSRGRGVGQARRVKCAETERGRRVRRQTRLVKRNKRCGTLRGTGGGQLAVKITKNTIQKPQTN